MRYCVCVFLISAIPECYASRVPTSVDDRPGSDFALRPSDEWHTRAQDPSAAFQRVLLSLVPNVAIDQHARAQSKAFSRRAIFKSSFAASALGVVPAAFADSEDPEKPAAADPALESDLVKILLKRTADNAAANNQTVQERTIKNNLPGTFAPWSSEIPILLEDGVDYKIISKRRYDRLKDRGKIIQRASGMEQFVPGFDPDAPEPKEKLFGIF